MKPSNATLIVVGIIAAVLLFFGIRLAVAEVAVKNAFDFIRSIGGVDFTTTTGQKGLTYKGYQFYPNNRVLQISSKRMGTYDVNVINWDDKTVTLISNI